MSYAIIDLKKKKIFDKIESNMICDELIIKIPEFKENKQIKYAKAINKLLKKNKVSKVVLADKLKKLDNFKNGLMQENNYIINGKKMYKVLINKLIKNIADLTKYEKEKMNVALLINEYNADNIEIIKMIADQVKSLTLITNNAYRFEQIVEELLNNKGIIVQLVNNGKFNLKRKHIIINIDFSNNDMNKINFPNDIIIVTNGTTLLNIKNSFNGIIINDIDIYLDKKIENFRTVELCEAYIYNNMKRIKENELIFNRSTYEVNGYFGKNGKIEQEDFERLGRIFLKNKRKSVKNNT